MKMIVTLVRGLLAITFTGLLLVASGCSNASPSGGQAHPQSAALSTFIDLSSSTAIIQSPAYADASIARVRRAVAGLQLGDSVRVVGFGLRTIDRVGDAQSIASDRKHRLPTVAKLTEAKVRSLISDAKASGGDGQTNILYTLENAQPVCTPRSKVIILSDGLEESEAYSTTSALAGGKSIQLPRPRMQYLKGCSVEFIGIGVSPTSSVGGTAQTLPNDQLQALIAGWREYLLAAGVRPDAMTFTSIL